MAILRNSIIFAVALLHFYFLILEMYLWTKPKGLKTFRMSKAQAEATATLAANQGLYNGFLATGLIWSLLADDVMLSHKLALYFFGCIFIAGVYGGYSVGKKIFLIQGLPAAMGLILEYCF